MKSAKQPGTYFRMVCSYIAVFLLPAVIIMMLLYGIFMEPVNEQALQLTIDAAEAAESACERQIQQAVTFYGMFLENTNLSNSFTPSDIVAVQDIKTKLKALKIPSNGAESFVYSYGDEYLYSSSTSYSIQRFLDFYHIEGTRTVETFQELLSDRKKALSIAMKVNDSKGGVMMLLHESYNARYLFYYLPHSAIASLFHDAMVSNEGLAMIHYEQDAAPLAFVFNDSQIGLEQYMNQLQRSADLFSGQSGVITSAIRVGNQDCVLVRCRASAFGLRYTMILHGAMEKRLQTVLFSFLLMMLISLILGTAFALYISRKTYQPIKCLRSKAGELIAGNPAMQDKDDYRNIYDAMEKLSNQNLLMRASVNDMQAYLTYKLFKGDMKNVEENNQLQRFFGISSYGSALRVCVVIYRQPTSVAKMNQQIRGILTENVQMIAQQLEEDRYALILIGDDRRRESIAEALKRIADQEDIKCVCVGELEYDLQMIPVSYVQARVTADCMTEAGMNGLLAYQSMSLAQPCTLLIEKIERALQQGDHSAVQCQLYALRQQIEDNNLMELRVLSNNLLMLLKRYCEENNRAHLAPDCGESYMILQYETAEEFKPLIDMLCERFQLAMLSEEEGKMESRQMDEVFQYLQTHYTSAELSVQQVMDEYGLDVQTMTEQFRRRVGMLPSDYIAKLRMDQAKRLLIRTDMSVADVGMEVGFMNTNSFIRRRKQRSTFSFRKCRSFLLAFFAQYTNSLRK